MQNSINPEGCTNLKLRQLNRILTRHYDRFLFEAGLKNTQYSLLSHVVKLGPIGLGDLAKQMEVEASTLTRNIQPLVSRGWLEISVGHDGRSRLVEATDFGRAKRTEAQAAWKRAQLALNTRLGSERVAGLHLLVDECTEILGGQAIPDTGEATAG